jgi:hypothetical protein
MKSAMRKLSLDLDQLSVESFDTLDTPVARRGTVRAYVCSDVCTASCDPTCGILPASAESECAALPESKFCGGTQGGMSECGPCCV